VRYDLNLYILCRRKKTDKWQTRPLVREGAPKWQDSNFQKKKKWDLWSKVPDWARHQDISMTDWLTVSCNVTLTLTLALTLTLTRPPLWSSGQSSWLHNGDVLCFLLGTKWIYICYVEESMPPLWSVGQRSSLQIQRPGFDSLRYQIFWEVVDLERGPLSLREYNGGAT
jgi:hypothetical protein